jgi:hypothetical protein
MANDPTQIQVALANAATKLCQMHEAQIAKTDESHICDDMDALLRLRAFAIELGKVCDPIFDAVAKTAHVGFDHAEHATTVSDAIEERLEYQIKAKAQEIFDARSDVDYLGAFKQRVSEER